MNKKGQGLPFTVMIVLVFGILLFVFTPAINEVRLSTLAGGGLDLFTTFILMTLIPILWILYAGVCFIWIKREMFSVGE